MDTLRQISNNSNLKIIFELFDKLNVKVNQSTQNYSHLQLIVVSAALTYALSRFYNSYLEIQTDLPTYFKQTIFNIISKFPYINAKISSEINKTQETLESDISKANKGMDYIRELPENGLTSKQLDEKINEYLNLCDANWKDGSCSGCVYGADEFLTNMTTEVYRKFTWSNVMHADVFPDVRKMEAEVVRMVLNLFNGDDKTCGTMTSGGTESIMLACKVYRDMARQKRGITKPEMIIPETAHAAFYKAGQFFNIRVIAVAVDPITKRAVPSKMRKYINSNTCMLVGSSPSFAHGVIDPIEEIGKLGVKYNLPVHVDACLGSFVVAFMSHTGLTTKLFDFRVPGVTSISCDTHKYAFTPKGSSVIMYRNRDYREYQYFSCANWPGGIYVSPTFAGSRPGALIAMTWATMLHFGLKGYEEEIRKIIKVTRYIENEVKNIKEIELMGDCDASIVSITSKEFNSLSLLDEMNDWHLNALQNPPGIHIAVTKLHTADGVAERFVRDLKKAVAEIMKKDDRQLGKKAQIYCTSQSVPDKRLISKVSYMYLDACYNTSLTDKKIN